MLPLLTIEKFIHQEGCTVRCLVKAILNGLELEMKRIHITDSRDIIAAASERELLIRLTMNFRRPNFINPLLMSFYTPGSLCLIQPRSSGLSLKDIAIEVFPMRREVALFYITEVILTLLYLESQNLGLRNIPPEKIMISSDGHIRIGDMDAFRVIDLSNVRRRRRPALYGCLAPLVVSIEVNPFQYPSDVFNSFAEYPEQCLYDMDLWNFVGGSI